MNREEILKIFKDREAILEGHFLLSSGLHSGKYLQCAKVLQYPPLAEQLCRQLAEMFKESKPDVVIGPALGGVIVAYEVARALGTRSLFAERKAGKMLLRRGFEIEPPEKVLIVEDVLTTGGSVREVIAAVKTAGASIVGVGALVDRTKETINFGVEFKSLLKIDLSVFAPQNCPLCKADYPLEKPGSRK
jgi:orotate phosphoribosyltransferase